MTKRVVIRTCTEEKADGTITTSSERLEEPVNSGLVEAWMALVLLLFTGLLFITTYRVVSSLVQDGGNPQDRASSSITQIQREQTNGVQEINNY